MHLSGIGADPDSPSQYVRAHAAGETTVRRAFAEAAILRPSVLFDPDDVFTNSLAPIVGHFPAIPPFGSGQSRLQPVFVDDVAEAAVHALSDRTASGSLFELGGPLIYCYRALLNLLCRQIGRRRLLIPVSSAIWRILARLSEILANQPLTLVQVALTERDGVVGEEAIWGSTNLGITPTALENALQTYLRRR